MKDDLVVSFSGGKTSAFMCHYLQSEWSHKYNFTYVFANTGREHEATLEFVKKCDEFFNLNLAWVEAVTNPIKGVGVSHRIVNFETASRNGEPFEAFIKKEGIPNVSKPTCTERLKTFAIKSYMHEIGFITHRILVNTAIGMRADEPTRCNPEGSAAKRHHLVYPLAHWFPFDKQDINTFWEFMPFNLEIPERYGNCVTCFKKSNNKLKLIAREHPEWFVWNDEMEEKYGEGHVFFRGNRSTKDLVGVANLADLTILKHLLTNDNDAPSTCGEECGAFNE